MDPVGSDLDQEIIDPLESASNDILSLRERANRMSMNYFVASHGSATTVMLDRKFSVASSVSRREAVQNLTCVSDTRSLAGSD